MKAKLDSFLLNQRIFLVKHFYQFNGDCLCVKTKYESSYKGESPVFSSDILMEIVSLFEQTGSVFRPVEASCDQIEQVYVKVETPEEVPQEEHDFLRSPAPQDSTQINPFSNSGSDYCDSSQESTSNADTLSNEEFPLVPGFGRSIREREKGLSVWWENPDDSLEAEDLRWNQEVENSQHFCPVRSCKRAFKSLTTLALHRISHPEDREKIHKCKKCDKVFLEQYALKRHFRRQHIPVSFKCSKCKCTFREEKNYRNHLEEHELEPDVFEEPTNSPEFKEPEATVKPRKSSNAFACTICSKGFRYEHFLALHMMTHEVQRKPRKEYKLTAARPKLPEKRFECEECGKISANAYCYKKHQVIHTKEYPYRCEVCGKGMIFMAAFRNHMAKHTGIVPKAESSFMCEICGRKLCNKITLLSHIEKIHLKPQKEFKCRVSGCVKSYPNAKFLRRHMDRHTGKLFKCSSCDVAYKDKSHLKLHIEKFHLKREAPYKCDKCGKASWQIDRHRKHMRLIHRIEDFQLNTTTKSNRDQKNHDRQEKPSKFPVKVRKKRVERFKTCEVCGKVCSTARYKKHTMTHSGERPIKCNICGKGFIYSCGYQKHLLWHQGIKTGLKRAMCEICGKKLTGEKILEAHIKKIHERPEHEFKCKVSGCGKSYPNEKFLRRHMDRHSGKMFKCSFCDLEYKDKSQLKIHMDKVHLKTEPPLKCELCGKGSWNIKDHRTHMKKLHQIDVPFVRKKQQKNIE